MTTYPIQDFDESITDTGNDVNYYEEVVPCTPEENSTSGSFSPPIQINFELSRIGPRHSVTDESVPVSVSNKFCNRKFNEQIRSSSEEFTNTLTNINCGSENIEDGPFVITDETKPESLSKYEAYVPITRSTLTNNSQNVTEYHSTLVNAIHANPVSINDDENFSCSVCGQVFATELELQQHDIGHCVKKMFSCDVCNTQFSIQDELESHQRKHAEDEKTYSCSVCKISFAQKSSVNRHIRQVHGSGSYQYEGAASTFTTLGLQQNIKPKELSVSCHICDRVFRKRSSVNRHLRLSHNINEQRITKSPEGISSCTDIEVMFCCEICKKTLPNERGLRRHMVVHKTEKRFSCNLCALTFRCQSSLTKHKETHMRRKEKKSYSCDVCKKSFRQLTLLKCHNLTHKMRSN